MLQDSARGWLMIIYRVPSTPSTSRVTVWKRVKELGAYLLQQSVYILPNLPRVKEALERLKDQISRLNGESKVIEIASLGEEQEKEVIAGFNANREEEYEEVIKACNELLREIEDESVTQDFHFADLEENEKHIQRVSDLLDDVVGRDYFGSSLQARAVALMEECRERFEEFSHEVFSRDGLVDEKSAPEPGRRHRERADLPRTALTDKVHEVLSSLEDGALEVQGKKVEKLAETVTFELEYVEQKNERSLEMRIEWVPSRSGKKT